MFFINKKPCVSLEHKSRLLCKLLEKCKSILMVELKKDTRAMSIDHMLLGDAWNQAPPLRTFHLLSADTMVN